jgi:hypothetical protein
MKDESQSYTSRMHEGFAPEIFVRETGRASELQSDVPRWEPHEYKLETIA